MQQRSGHSETAMDVELDVRTDRGEYVGGDTIYGSVYLCVKKKVESKALRLAFKGYEISEYDYQYVHRQDDSTFIPKISKRTAKKDVVKVEFKLEESNHGFSEGCYSYPFQYQLPHNIPGSFNVQHEDMDTGKVWQGVIKYTITAFLDAPEESPERRGAQAEVPVVIYDKLECRNTNAAPDKCSATGSVRTFFCIHRGEVNVSSRLDKCAYGTKDKINVSVTIDNQSAVEVIGARVKLIRVIKLYGVDRNRGEEDMTPHTIYDTVTDVHQDGCQKNTSRTHNVVIDLGKISDEGVPPSASGSLIKSNYVIDIDVQVPWAPDVEVRQPLLIKTPPNNEWNSWKPARWLSDCVQVPVTGSCSVPHQLITSQSFSGMPGFQPIL